MPVDLTESATRGLAEIGRAAAKAGAHSTVEVRIPEGSNVGAAEDDVVVVVFGRKQGYAFRKQVRAGPPDARELRLWMATADLAISDLAKNPPEAAALTAAEAELLDEADFGEARNDAPGAYERSRISYDMLLRRESWSLAQAAKVLRVNPSRLRQRLSPASRTLYGIKDGRAWRIPKFQFSRGKLVRGIGEVIPHLRADAHPLAVRNWFLTPHQDLLAGASERPVSPIAWLSNGQPPAQVAALAEEI